MTFLVIANVQRRPLLPAKPACGLWLWLLHARNTCSLHTLPQWQNHITASLLGTLLGLSGAGCSRTASSETPTVSTLAAVVTVQPKSDKLGELELIATKELAYSLEVPRGLRVTYRFEKAIHLEGDARGDAVANFLRARVGDGQITVGATETVFERVRPQVEPSRVLNIRVIRIGSAQTKVLIEDVTPAPDKPGTNAERWQRAGFGPDGKPLDPTKVE